MVLCLQGGLDPIHQCTDTAAMLKILVLPVLVLFRCPAVMYIDKSYGMN